LTALTSDHVKITREIAAESPCARRRYGCLITNGKDTIVTANLRVSKCCNGFCVRDTAGFEHGQAVDFGAEIHAEQAALIKWNHPVDKNTKLLIQAYHGNSDELFYDKDLYPCHVCALMIKYAGFKFINITTFPDGLYSVSIDDVIEYREKAWGSYLIDA
jgi:deoxycytidylate deaminase